MREIELRGRLTAKQYAQLEAQLQRLTPGERNDKRSQFFRFDRGILKVSEHQPSGKVILSLKLGDETRNSLDEHEVELRAGMFDRAVTMVAALGYPKRELVEQQRTDYRLGDITLSLKCTPDWGPHFEVEMLAEATAAAEAQARQALVACCDRFGLTPMAPAELAAFLARIAH